MRISTIGYVGKQGVKSIWRNKMFSLASIATMSACIFLFGLFFSILVNFQYIIRSAEEGVAITVFFDEEATDEQIQKIGEELKARDDVSEVKYISAEQAWKDFQKEFARMLGTRRRLALSDAVFYLGEDFQGKEHDALWDARNTAEVFVLSKDREKFEKIMAPIMNAYKPKENMTYSIGDVFGNINLPE